VKRPITIHIAGQRYLVKSDADEQYVQGLASSVEAKVQELKGSRQIATQADVVLAALQLADELEHERRARRELKQLLSARARRMLEYLDQLSTTHEAPSGDGA
jgi:cell division protein ZapA (FtsZ GTPase activity inhibitor)